MLYSKSLKLNHIFRRLYQKGQSAANRYLVLYHKANNLPENRVGITVSTKFGHAVYRNRIRRQLREIYRLHEQEFLPGQDIVVVVRSRAAEATYQDLETAYLKLADRLSLLRKDETA